MKSIRYIWLIAIMMMIGGNSISAQAPDPAPDLTTVTLEELMNIEVTSVSKKEEKLFQSAAAIYVITQEDIRRSGLTSIPELLRMAPGLNVARIDGNKWAISARGFNGRYANKLLVHELNVEDAEGGNPEHQYQFHSYFKLARNLESDAALYHVSHLPAQQIPAYTRLDVRFGWKVKESFEFSLNLQNLLDDRHPEFDGPDVAVITSQARRGVYGKATWRF